MSFFFLTSHSIAESDWWSLVTFTCDKSSEEAVEELILYSLLLTLANEDNGTSSPISSPDDSHHIYAYSASPFCWRKELTPERESKKETRPTSCCSTSPLHQRANPIGQKLGLFSVVLQQYSPLLLNTRYI